MAGYEVSVAAEISAPADKVYGVIADYHAGHPRILPRPPFGDLVVEERGLRGLVERLLSPPFLRRTFRQELALLAGVVRES